MHNCIHDLDIIAIKHNGIFITNNNQIIGDDNINKYADVGNGYIQFKICKKCLSVIKINEPVVQTQQPHVEYINDYIDHFVAFVKNKKYDNANAILKKLAIRISPYDYQALMDCYADVRAVSNFMDVPEFDDIINDIKKHNANAVYHPVLR